MPRSGSLVRCQDQDLWSSGLELEATFDDQGTTILTDNLPTGNSVHYRDKMGLVRNTFIGKRDC
jgi:hypothetical protein